MNYQYPDMAPPGELINIGDYRLHLNCLGHGGPVVILDSGLGGFSLEWLSIQRALSDKVKICAYDRAGYGWSDFGPPPRTTKQIAYELHALLENAELPPPYILVGHSFGGYNIQYFAKIFPELVSGLLFVDASHPEQTERLPNIPAYREPARTGRTIPILVRQFNFENYPEDIRAQASWIMSLRKTHKTQLREYRNFALSAEQVMQAGDLKDMPLIAISRGKRVWPEHPYGDNLELVWKQLQLELSELTPSGRQIIAHGSGHLVHMEQPKVVTSAILSIIGEVVSQQLE